MHPSGPSRSEVALHKEGSSQRYQLGRQNSLYLSLTRNCSQCPAGHSTRQLRRLLRHRPGRRRYPSQTLNRISPCIVTLPSYNGYPSTSVCVNSNSRCAKETFWSRHKSVLNTASSNARCTGSTNVEVPKLCSSAFTASIWYCMISYFFHRDVASFSVADF